MNTNERPIAAAAALLDSGGGSPVTLRAVGAAVGVSHNAPYKHFKLCSRFQHMNRDRQ